jgi:hypothetical protein
MLMALVKSFMVVQIGVTRAARDERAAGEVCRLIIAIYEECQ